MTTTCLLLSLFNLRAPSPARCLTRRAAGAAPPCPGVAWSRQLPGAHRAATGLQSQQLPEQDRANPRSSGGKHAATYLSETGWGGGKRGEEKIKKEKPLGKCTFPRAPGQSAAVPTQCQWPGSQAPLTGTVPSSHTAPTCRFGRDRGRVSPPPRHLPKEEAPGWRGTTAAGERETLPDGGGQRPGPRVWQVWPAPSPPRGWEELG